MRLIIFNNVSNFNDFAILNINGDNFYYITNGISKNEFVNLLQNTDLSKTVANYLT